MSTPILQASPEEINTPEKRGKYTVSIIEREQAGILPAVTFADAGFKVICVDTDQTVVNNLAKGRASSLETETENKLKNHVKVGRMTATDDIKKAVSQSDLIAISIPVRIDAKKKPDYSDIEKACKRIGSCLRRGSLVLVINLTGIGVTEHLIKETLENTSGLKVGNDFGLAYSPFHTLNGETVETARDYSEIVAATDKNSLNAASTVLEAIMKKGIVKTRNTKTAEVTALFEMLRQDTDAAVVNELALFCEKTGVDLLEVRRLAEAHGNALFLGPVSPNGSVREGSYLLLEDAENLNVKLRIPSTAREVNEEIVKHAANLAKDALRNCGKTLRRAKISILGISQTPNAKGSPKKLVEEIAAILEARGAKVTLYDPHLKEYENSENQARVKKTLAESLEGSDCAIVLTGHDQFKRLNLRKLKHVMKMPAAIIDFEGILDAGKIEKEGFIYRGRGRGIWTK